MDTANKRAPEMDQVFAMYVRMKEIQNELNILTCGPEWVSGVTEDGKPIDWYRCMYMEAAELVDSFPWKHWKSIDSEPDIDNAKIEVVDIWHFILSQINASEQQKSSTSIDALFEKLANKHGRVFGISDEPFPEININYLLQEIDLFISNTAGAEPMYVVMDYFFGIVDNLNMTFEELYGKYLEKSVLNKFRQKHGYKDGTYQKLWYGVEDNAVMAYICKNVFEDGVCLSPDMLYAKLEEEYDRVLNGKSDSLSYGGKQ